ncbi:hypothetical protein BGZ72_002963 [Mortierella alpina]|nr:hypothetical protein BGZ72_002963 [Mortierella alpina]
MSFTDLERGLSTPPVSPRRDSDKSTGRVLGPLTTSIPNSRAFMGPTSNSFASISPPVKLPSGLQVTRGNSRDSIGLNLSAPLQAKPQQRPSHSPHPPPVSPTRTATTNSPLAQHSRFKQDNTRIDTPRPTLTPSTVAAAVSGASAAESGSAPRSPHAVPYASANSGASQNRILVDYRPGDQDRRQVLSPPTSPPQFSSSFPSSLHQQHRGDSRGPHDAGAFHTPSNFDSSSNNHGNNDTAINMEAGTHEASTTTDQDPDSTGSSVAIPTATTTTSLPAPFSSPDQEHDYDLMVRHLSQQIFNISSNIAVLERLVPCLGQRHKDTMEMRASLHAVLDGTQDLVKSAHSLVKVLARYHQPPPAQSSAPSLTSSSSASAIPIGIRAIPPRSLADLSSWQRKVLASRRQTHQRLTKDLAVVSKAFQDLQRQVVEAERRQVAALRRLSSSASLRRISNYRSDLMDLTPEEIESLGAAASAAAGHGYGSISSSSSSSSNHGIGGSSISNNSNNNNNQRGSRTAAAVASGSGSHSYMHDRELSVQEEAMLREILVMDGELAFHESMLQEREFEIQKIEEGMGQVLDVMKELGTLVHEQRAGVDFLHDNIMQTRGRVQQAQHEILKASEHQRRSREKLCYLIMITSIVGAMVMLAFVST